MDQKDIKEKKKKELRDKIKRAIWMHNRLIDTHPQIYEAMKEVYEKENK